MKRILTIVLLSLLAVAAFARNADAIVGDYHAIQNSDEFKVRISKNDDGTYKGQIFWLKNDIDPKTGLKLTDTRNPDKSLRDVPCDQVVLFDGLQYNPKKSRWDGTKIYDPQRGLKAHLTITIEKEGKIRVKGKLLGISETVVWDKIR